MIIVLLMKLEQKEVQSSTIDKEGTYYESF